MQAAKGTMWLSPGYPRLLRGVWKPMAGVATVLLVTISVAFGNSRDQRPAQAEGLNQGPPPGATYVGASTCQACHDELYKQFMTTVHSATTRKSHMTGEAHGCESCHGPGSAHVEGGGDITKIFRFTVARPEQISARCLTCHGGHEEQQQFVRSTHNDNGITCTNCHSVHHAKEQYLLVKKQVTLCFSCHQEEVADFQKPFRHRVLEGLIFCSDCHNPHGALFGRRGTFQGNQVLTTADQQWICVKCHVDKRGPFVFEHNAVAVEGCLVCHFPHGSTNPRMLTTARINSLCLQCHAAPSGPHNQSGKAQDCILCHSQIHGSNLSDVFFK